MALVLVLGFLVLMTVLVVAFFSSVTTDLTSAKASASGLSARQLAASAVQVMQGTITNATEPRDDTTVAWASQPGMIRTYGDGGTASDKPLNYYKLYSSDKMIVTKNEIASFIPENDLDLAWDTKPALFSDLNAPITDTNSNTVFPIVDPRAARRQAADPQKTEVEGFDYITGKVAQVVTADKGDAARLPMPVKWIYVLRDGTMTAPTAGDAATATFTGTQVPTSANPIIGRIAFWTDDESAKVNINTASEGTYWDAPIANTGKTDGIPPDYKTPFADIALAQIQGAQYEYQRYPGHPATTCLSTVFGPLLNGLSRDQMVKAITDAIPRVKDDAGPSSMGGTAAPTAGMRLKTDIDRLYATVDEFAFTTARAPQSVNSSVKDIVQRSRFFLTANSKAPELNLFGLPRVALWPIWDDTHQTNRTDFDKAILRCATVANSADATMRHPMIFTRMNPDSPTADFSDAKLNTVVRNPQVYGYLHKLMSRPVPGFGSSFSSTNKFGSSNAFGAKDYDQILTEMFDYIRCVNLADNSINNDGTAATPYTGGTNYGQVVPIHIDKTTAPDNAASTMGFGRISTLSELAIELVKIDDRKDAMKADASDNRASTVGVTGGPSSISSVDPATQTLVEWTLIPRLVSPMLGYIPMKNNLRFRFKSIDMTIGSTSVSVAFPDVPDVYDIGRYSTTNHGSVIGGPLDPMALVEGATPTQPGAPSDSMFPTGLALVSGTSDGGPMTIKVTGITVELYAPASSPPPSGALPLQTFKFALPSTQVPVPKLALNKSVGDPKKGEPAEKWTWIGAFRGGTYTAMPAGSTFSYNKINKKNLTRIDWNINHNADKFIKDQCDVVRSLTAGGTMKSGSTTGPTLNGDTRLIAMAENVPDSAYTLTNPLECDSANGKTNYSKNSHCMRDGTGFEYCVTNFAVGTATLLPGVSYGTNTVPDVIPPQIKGQVPGIALSATSAPIPGTADWDNGIGLGIDGPWINKPDEGMAQGTTLKSTAYIGSYDSVESSGVPQATLFSPNRQISSPIMFGSLPVGFSKPWQTLLFRPAQLPGYHSALAVHPGNPNPATIIPDHLLLDLFWMPVVEPFSISEPLATAGKINLNTQIAPFTYITRNTGMNAVLKAVAMTALDTKYTGAKKGLTFNNDNDTNGGLYNPTGLTRFPVDADQTLNQLTNSPNPTTASYPVFSRKTHTAALPNFFVSPSQICDLPLIPAGTTPPTTSQTASLSSFWTKYNLTGDNSLERPYSLIYSRVTTKSNVFTVHVRAQSLQKVAGGKPDVWREGRDQVSGEFRGSYTIEKFFDPNEGNITDKQGAALTNSTDMKVPDDAAVRGTRWRLVSSKQFGQ